MDNSKALTRTAVICVLASAAAPLGAALAQSEAGQLEEIIVTAQKREQSLNDVGISVAVVSEDTLKTRRVGGIQDLTDLVPSMSYAESTSGVPTISIRGIGVNEKSLASYPAVSLYMDQVPLTFPIMAAHAVFDLERVEVLQGPQGTVFGQNVTGGAINYIAAKPTDEFAAGVTVGGGRFNRFEGEAYISGALSETVAARLSGRYERASGWQRSLSRPGDKNGKVDYFAGRLLVDLKPSDAVKLQLNLNGWKDSGETIAPQLIGLTPQSPGFMDAAVLATPFATGNRQADWDPDLPYKDDRFVQASLRGDLELGGDLTLTSITSYSDFKQNAGNDWDGVPVPLQSNYRIDGKIKDFYQELRIANGASNRLRWMLGGNYGENKLHQIIDLRWYNASNAWFFASFWGHPDGNRLGTSGKTDSLSGFGNVEYDLNDQLTLKAGIRYTKFKATNDSFGTDLTGPPYVLGTLFYDLLLGGAPGPYSPGLCFPVNDLGTTINGVAPGMPGCFSGKLKENNTPWRLAVDWKPNADTLVYASVTKGFKAGNFGTMGASVWSQYLPVTQESVLSYETGFKLTALDRRVQVNGAAFYYDYKDKQLFSRVIDPIWGSLEALQNIPKSKATGVELSLLAKAGENLTFSANATYIDAKIKRFTGVNAAGVAASFDGTRMPFSPKWSGNVSADYTMPLNGELRLVGGANVSFRSSAWAIIGANENPTNLNPVTTEPLYTIDSYALVGAHLGVETDRWRAMLWGKNLFNKYYWNAVVPASDTIVRYPGLPATWGVTLSYTF